MRHEKAERADEHRAHEIRRIVDAEEKSVRRENRAVDGLKDREQDEDQAGERRLDFGAAREERRPAAPEIKNTRRRKARPRRRRRGSALAHAIGALRAARAEVARGERLARDRDAVGRVG
jgi:hypothetical protein